MYGGIDVTLNQAGDALSLGLADRLYMARSENRGQFAIRRRFATEYDFPSLGFVGDREGRFVGLFFDSGPADSGLYARTERPDGRFGPRQTLDPRPDRLLDWVILERSPAGDIFAVWSSESAFCACNAQLRARVRRAGDDHFGPAQVLSPSGRAAYQPRIAFDREGNALVAWAQFRDVSRAEVAYATRPADADAFGATRKLSAGGTKAAVGSLALAANRAGRAIAVWTARFEPDRDVWAAFGTVAGGFESVQSVARGRAHVPRVAVDRSGEALATWNDPRPTIASAPPHGQFGAPTVLEAGRATAPSLRADGAGTFTAAWRRQPGGAVHVLRRRAGSTSTRVVEVDPRRAWRISMAVTAAHDTLVAWSLRGAHVGGGIKDALVALGRPGRELRAPLDLRTGHWGGPAYPNDYLRMAVDGEGGAFVWWRHPDHRGDDGYYGRFLFPPGGAGSG
ncbi:MAG: hypothetical protein QOJ14_1155 [Thermoleophilaceae bacterium]|nr:hypothetical protein [Thermoleophilaceae bacterium]